MRGHRLNLRAAAFGALIATGAALGGAEEAPAPRLARIGVLDIQRVEAETALGRDYRLRLERVRQEAEARERELTAAGRAGGIPAERLRVERQQLRRDTERRLEHLRTALRQRLRPFMNRTVRERRLDLTLDARYVVYASPEVDISGEVIARAASEAKAALDPPRE